MTGAASKLREWKASGGSALPIVGVDDFVALVPIDEPLSVGLPPTPPNLVEGMGVGRARRDVKACSGHRVTAPLDLLSRPKVSMAWTGLSLSQTYALRIFLKDDIRGTDKGSELAFDVEVDGPGVSGGTVSFVLTASPSYVQVQGGGGVGGGAWNVTAEGVQVL